MLISSPGPQTTLGPLNPRGCSDCMHLLCCVESVLYVVRKRRLEQYAFQGSASTPALGWHSRNFGVRPARCAHLRPRLRVPLRPANRLVEVRVAAPLRGLSRLPGPISPGGCGSAHEGRVVVIGIRGAPPSALVDDVWTELPRLHPAATHTYAVLPLW